MTQRECRISYRLFSGIIITPIWIPKTIPHIAFAVEKNWMRKPMMMQREEKAKRHQKTEKK